MNSTNTFLRWVAVSAIYAALITPFIVANSLFFPFITGKALWFRLFVEIAFIAWALLSLRDARFLPKKSNGLIAITIFIVAGLISSIVAESPAKAFFSNFERMEGFFTLLHLYMVYIVLSSLFKTFEEWRKLFMFSLGVASLVALGALGQLFGFSEINQSDTRLDARLGNAAYLALYMCMHACLAIYVLVSTRIKGLGLYIGYGSLSVLFLFIMFFTATRGTMIGLFLGFLVATIMYLWMYRKQPEHRTPRIIISSGILALILVVSSLIFISRKTDIELPSIIERYAGISWGDTKTQARSLIWPMAIKGFMERPILGWGQEGFNYVFNENYDKDMWRHEQWFDRAHNVYLDWLVAGGLLGFMAYIGLYLVLAINFLKAKIQPLEKIVLIGILIAYALHNFFIFDNLSSYIIFFMLFGYGTFLTKQEDVVSTDSGMSSKESVQWLIAILVVLCVGALFWGTYVKPYRANKSLILGMYGCQIGKPDAQHFLNALRISRVAEQEATEQLLICATNSITNDQLSQEQKINLIQIGTDSAYSLIERRPRDARLYIILASSLNRIGQNQKALDLLKVAQELTPEKHSVYLETAIAYMGLNQNQQAIEYVQKAYEMSPDYREVQVMYALVLILSDTTSEANAFIDQHRDILRDQRVSSALIAQKKYPLAITSLTEYLKDQPQDFRMRFILAGVYLLTGDRVRAQTEIEYIITTARGKDLEQAQATLEEIKKGRNPIKLQ